MFSKKNCFSFQAESEVSQLTRKLHSFEEQLERTEARLAQTTSKLDEASHAADERERLVLKNKFTYSTTNPWLLRFFFSFNFRSRKMLENQLNLGSDRTENLESQLKEARTLAAESDRKYDEVSC